MALSVATEFIGEVEIDGRLKIKGEGKVFPNHTHVALSSSLTIFTLFLVLILQGSGPRQSQAISNLTKRTNF